jgi:hypothetical protein
MGAAFFAGCQMLLARRTSGLQSLQSFDKAATEREAALLEAATDGPRHEYAFNEYMNFLELYAGACNRHLLSGSLLTGFARRFVRDRLLDSVVVIERAGHELHIAIDRAIYQPGTFEELRRFAKRNRKRLAARRAIAEARTTPAQTVPSS